MAFCPSCSAEIASDALHCPACNARFGEGATWKPLPLPPVAPPPALGARIFFGLVKSMVALVSLAALLLGGLFAAGERNQGVAALMAVAGIAVVAVAFMGRLRWTLLAMFLAIAVGLATCVTNFKWHGG